MYPSRSAKSPDVSVGTVMWMATVSSEIRITQTASKSSLDSGAIRTGRFGSEMTRPSRWSIRRASRNGVRPVSNRVARIPWGMVAPGSSSPRKIAVLRRSWTVATLALWRGGRWVPSRTAVTSGAREASQPCLSCPFGEHGLHTCGNQPRLSGSPLGIACDQLGDDYPRDLLRILASIGHTVGLRHQERKILVGGRHETEVAQLAVAGDHGP